MREDDVGPQSADTIKLSFTKHWWALVGTNGLTSMDATKKPSQTTGSTANR